MTKPPHWRSIEAALVSLARDWGSGFVYDDRESGDKSYEIEEGSAPTSINLTELAKDLAKELER